MLNYLIYQEFKLPQPNPTYLVNALSLTPNPNQTTIYPRGLPVDGNINNCRTLTFTLGAATAADTVITIIGSIFNGSQFTETVTIAAGDTTENSVNRPYEIYSIIPNVSVPTVLSVGFGDGYSALCQMNGSKTDHFVTFGSGNPGVTVYGSMTPFINEKTTVAMLKEFPLSTTLTNISTSMTAPEYNLLPLGFCRAYIAANANVDVEYRIGFQNLRG